MSRRILIKLFSLVLGAPAFLSAQDLTITNARIIAANGSVIERGSIVVRAGSIVSVAPGRRTPERYRRDHHRCPRHDRDARVYRRPPAHQHRPQ